MITEYEVGLQQAGRRPLHVIALSGPIGAGKSTLARQLVARDKYWQPVSFAAILKNLVVQMTGVPITDANKSKYRRTLQEFGQLMRALHGESYWAKRAVESARVQGHTHIVIDDLRFRSEIAYLQEAADHVYPVRLNLPLAAQQDRHLAQYKQALTSDVLTDASEHDLDHYLYFKTTIDAQQEPWLVLDELERGLRRHYVDYHVGRGRPVTMAGDLVFSGR